MSIPDLERDALLKALHVQPKRARAEFLRKLRFYRRRRKQEARRAARALNLVLPRKGRILAALTGIVLLLLAAGGGAGAIVAHHWWPR